MKYYIADCHFGDDKARILDHRPFENVEMMDCYMIQQWNQVIKKRKDEVYIIGDFCRGKGERVNELIYSLKGKKYLISGNHDRGFIYDKKLDSSLFEWIKPYAEIHDNNRKVVLSHYPMICYNGQYYGNTAFMLYGHIHNTIDYQNVKKFIKQTRNSVYEKEKHISCNLINCFAGFSHYQPKTLDEWIAIEEQQNSLV